MVTSAVLAVRNVVILAVICGLPACGGIRALSGEKPEFDGQTFRAKLSRADRSNRMDFTVEVSPVSASFAGAREAGRFEATRYCVRNFGTSDILWQRGPDDAADTLPIVSDRLTFQGRCLF